MDELAVAEVDAVMKKAAARRPAKIVVKPEKLAEEMFRLAVEMCPCGMLMIDRDGRIITANAEIEQQFGHRREELIGQSVEVLVPARLRTQHAAHLRAFNLRPETRHIESRRDLVGLRKDGHEFPIEIALNPIQVGEQLFVVGVILDITERKRIEQMKDAFVATVSHELRTPLTSIAAALGLLTGNATGKLAEPTQRLLTIAYTNSQRLIRLINDILDIDKMESGKVVFDFKRVAVRPLLEQTIQENNAFATSYNVRIRLDASSDADDVRADPERLVQVVTNLLSNAIKFSPSGAEVIVAFETRGDAVRIAVRDRGNGVPDEFKPHIFEKFSQADTTDARQRGGSGLGLNIVQQIVLRMDGRVGFDAVDGGGTIFYVDLPSADQPAYRAADSAALIKPAQARTISANSSG